MSLAHPDWVRRFNYLGDIAGGPAEVVGLDPDELLATACAATGLDDLGDEEWPGWEETYRRCITSIDGESQLHLLGRVLTRSEVLRILRTWLRLQDHWRAEPAIAREPIAAPLFVVGPPRTGTTILLELLALDPQLRAPLAWEALHPVGDLPTERRLELAECEQEFWADIHPAFMTMHELANDLPCECVHFLAYDFAGPYFGMLYDTPGFTGWQLEHPETSARVYRLHRRMLQTFQFGGQNRSAPKQWLLKSPYHVATLPALFAEYPDARVIHTHRDPAKFVPSLVSILSAVRFMRSDAVDPTALGPIMEMTYQMFLEGTIAQRETNEIPDAQIVDSHFVDVMKDPVGALHDLYDRLALAWPAGHDRAITDYLDTKPKAKHGEHTYSLGSLGLDDAHVRAAFARYVEHYGIREE